MVEITHTISCDDFVIFVSYDKEFFGEEKNQFICKIVDNAKNSGLYRFAWKVNCPLVEETQNQDCHRFSDCINIIFTMK